ncbi:uncharacterized protein LOC135481678 [Liolophura sinensis]|uniref:uncharacterized protein LOC135481678 n=1 Tax=Liolophura sinensis TaxID=3198878 RepID=UPI0031592097
MGSTLSDSHMQEMGVFQVAVNAQRQSENEHWNSYRDGRITSSIFSNVLSFKGESPNYLVKFILHHSSIISSEAIQYGMKNEPIQGQMGICEHNWCDFVLFTGNSNIFVERIHKDKDYLCNMLSNLCTFYHKYVYPKLLRKPAEE